MEPCPAGWFGRLGPFWSTVTMLAVALSLAGCGAKPSTKSSPAANKKSQDARSQSDVQTSEAERQSLSGEQLYAHHCAACHGTKGDGKGIAAQFLFPKPRDFRAGRFRLVSTSNGVPTLDDIRAVLRRGMPGSSMPPWPKLNDAESKSLAEHVISLTAEGVRDKLRAAADESGDELSAEDLKEAVEGLTTPGDVVSPGDLGDSTNESIARGKELYATRACNQCHGTTGKGDGQQQMVDSEGLPTRPRDLTRGIFKGSPEPASIWRRIALGMPGSPMPSSQNLTAQETSDLTHFILSLSDDAVRRAAVLTREHILAQQVASLPMSADSPAWEQIPRVSIRSTPLWWRDDADAGLSVQAAHDGKSIGFRLSWRDSQADQSATRSEDFEDAVAVELFKGDREPFFGMGATGAVVDMWFWDADRQSQRDVDTTNPNLVVDVYPLSEVAVASAEYDRAGTATSAQATASLPAAAAGNQIVPDRGRPAASSLETSGPGSATFRPPKSQLVTAHGQWTDGRWTVLMTRSLAVGSAEGVSLRPGEKAAVAFAIWDGARKDRDGKKLVTIWQDLELEQAPGR